jgi:hypothetical protein
MNSAPGHHANAIRRGRLFRCLCLALLAFTRRGLPVCLRYMAPTSQRSQFVADADADVALNTRFKRYDTSGHLRCGPSRCGTLQLISHLEFIELTGPLSVSSRWFRAVSSSRVNTRSLMWAGNKLTHQMLNVLSESPAILPMRQQDREVSGKSRVKSASRQRTIGKALLVSDVNTKLHSSP